MPILEFGSVLINTIMSYLRSWASVKKPSYKLYESTQSVRDISSGKNNIKIAKCYHITSSENRETHIKAREMHAQMHYTLPFF